MDSSAERITTAPTLLGSDLKLYLRNEIVISARDSASLKSTRMEDLHFICDLPSAWEHARTWMILGKYVNGLSESCGSGQNEDQQVCSPRSRFVGDSRSKRLYLPSVSDANLQSVGSPTNFLPIEHSGV